MVDTTSRVDAEETCCSGCDLSRRCGGGRAWLIYPTSRVDAKERRQKVVMPSHRCWKQAWLMELLVSMKRRQGVVDATSRIDTEEVGGRG